MTNLDEMERRFPPVELNFAEALDQIRAGREVRRVGHENGWELPVTVGDINADDWIIVG